LHLATTAIVCALRQHGEHGVIARLMTVEAGLLPGYVRGGRSRRLRPILVPGNLVAAEFRARNDDQLATLTVELVTSRAPLLGEPLAAAAIEWACALTATILSEHHPYPRIYQALDGLLGAIEAAPSVRGWAAALVRYELLLLAELGFGLDLSRCAVTGSGDDLVWVSPKSGMAVSRAAGTPHAEKLLPLPPFLREGGQADWPDLFAGLRLTAHFLRRDLLDGKRLELLAARERLEDRLHRAAGPVA
jgi:DNA repair protein RecO (recombination protein O)